MIKAVIFDYDDTLVKTRESKWDAIRETAKRFFDLDIDNDHISKFWGLPFEQMLAGSLKNSDTFENLRDKYFEVTTEFPMEEHEGASDLINNLVPDYLLGIVTASNRKLVIDDLKRLSFPVDMFFEIQTAEDTSIHKPNPKVFEPILQKLSAKGVNQDQVLYVGDGLKDWFAARDAGLNFIGITHGTTTKKEFNKEGAKAIDNFSELMEKIRLWNQ